MVAGGGVAGVCAAIAAARCGVRTLLVERERYYGGTGYAGLLEHICGLYLNGETIPSETLNDGLTREIIELLAKKSSQKAVKKIGQVYVLPFAAHDLLDVFDTLLAGEQDLTLLRNTVVTGIEVMREEVRSVIVSAPDGMQSGIAVSAVVDCTGNGCVSVWAGAAFELSPPDERQLAGFSIQISGLKGGDDTLPIKVPYYCAQAVEQGMLPPQMKFTAFNYSDVAGQGFIKMSVDGDDSLERNALASENARLLLAYLGEVLPSFRGAIIKNMALKVLDREGRRIIGDYMLTEKDILAARKFPDAIVRNAWPIELWDRDRGTLYKYLSRGDHYEIPFRCITVKGINNLLTAGRCISVSHEALGSTRVMGTCMALGEQAGLAAAYYVNNGKYPGTITKLP